MPDNILMMGYYLGDLLHDLVQGIAELLDSLRCNPAPLDGLKHNVPVLLDLGQVSLEVS